jgi:Cyclophilin type peptidyl-prolyl cis-trans isomerase/CLD
MKQRKVHKMRKMMTTLFTCLTAIALVTGCSTGSNETAPNQPTTPAEKPVSKEPANPPGPTGEKKYEKAPAMQIDKAKDYQAKISTSMGDITIDLFEKDAPIAVNNFVFLAKDKYYDGITFHRVMKDFMIQTGDPLANGKEGEKRLPKSSNDDTVATGMGSKKHRQNISSSDDTIGSGMGA